MDTSHSILHFAKRFFAGTMLSRISGALRDIAMAFCFGSAPEIAAFMVAYRLANLFRRLFGEGSLQGGLVPQFASLYGESTRRGVLFYRDSFFSLLAVLIFGSLVIEGAFFGATFFLDADWAHILSLSMKMVPGLLFICLYALNSSFLQYHKRYFVTAASPVLFNCFWIGVALCVANWPIERGVEALSLGITGAFALQWFVTSLQVIPYLSLSWRELLSPSFFSTDWRKMMKSLSFGIVGIGATQINSALDAIFSRMNDLSGPAYLWYAIRVEQLPLALFGIALSGALLPPLARAVAQEDWVRYQGLLQGAIRHSLSLIVPCFFGLLALGAPGLNLLYGHGDFSSQDVQQTLYCLWGYSIGLIPSVLILLIASAFYAQKSYIRPMLASLISVGFHIVLNTIMVFGFKWGAFSIALSTSLSAWVNCGLLVFLIQRFIPLSLFASLYGFLGRLVFLSSVAAVFPILLCGIESESRSIQTQMTFFISSAVLFLGLIVLLAYWMKVDEIFDLLKKKRLPENQKPLKD